MQARSQKRKDRVSSIVISFLKKMNTESQSSRRLKRFIEKTAFFDVNIITVFGSHCKQNDMIENKIVGLHKNGDAVLCRVN